MMKILCCSASKLFAWVVTLACDLDQRISRVPEGNKTTNKRLSMSTKTPETHTKTGKVCGIFDKLNVLWKAMLPPNVSIYPQYGDMNRPNKQFYQLIEEYRETVEKVPLTLSDPVSRLAVHAYKMASTRTVSAFMIVLSN